MANETNNKEFRIESDLLGELQVPANAYYGVQTQRAVNNYHISGKRMCDYPDYVIAMAYVKLAAVETNRELGEINDEICDAMAQACREIIDGKFHEDFVTDMVQGGAGTSVNMNANEVIANRACEILGHQKGEHKYCAPNDHANCCQSTNDAYPSAIHLALIRMNKTFVEKLAKLVASFRKKAEEFKKDIKMGRTQLQDAVPMTSGQEFNAFANLLEAEIANLNKSAEMFLEINMGGTAIGTGLNAAPGFPEICAKKLSELTGMPFKASEDLVAATPDTTDLVNYSGAMKRLAIKLSKIWNDLRLMASGPRCGLHEINLPPMAPGSSIMPGKVNPVIPEITNQTCFKVIGNDTTVTLAAEAGQLQLNVMEPIIMQCLVEDITWLGEAFDTLREKCIDGITVNREHNAATVKNSIGIVTALNPYIGYKNSTKIAKEALETGGSVYDLVLKNGVLTKEQLDKILSPEHMLDSEEKVK